MNERPYWLDTLPVSPVSGAVPLPERVDVAVIGAGFTGLSAALAIAKRGGSVAVLERHSVAWGASSRNGGMVLTGLKVPAEALLAKFGQERARALYATSLASIDWIERFTRDESIDCDFARVGHLEVANKRSHLEGFRRSADTLERHFNRTVRIVDRQELSTEIGSEAYHGGLIDDSSAGLDPARFAAGLAQKAKTLGAIIAEEAEVQGIETTTHAGSRAFRVTTARGTLLATDVLAASGAYTGRVTPALQRRVIPVGSYVIATAPLGATLGALLIPKGRMIFDSNNFLHYYRLTPDGRMLFGGRAAFLPANERTVRDSAAILRRGMLGVFPQLRDVPIDYAWGGTIDFTFDMLPHAGVIDGVHYALGYAGHGVAMATYAGAHMAEVIAGERPDGVLPSGPLPAPPPGFSGASPWFLPFAGAWYKFMDWAS